MIQRSVIGFLNLAFTQDCDLDATEIRSLMAFAHLAARAIENARLYEQAKEIAIHDELTGIYNRRGLRLFAEREFDRARRYRRPLSVIFCDVDKFKSFNDTYSYAVGDQVLKAIAECLRQNLREIDILGRFGGDEFVILLPETKQNDAVTLVRRLDQVIRAVQIPYNHGHVSVSLSFGVVQLSERDQFCDALIERAADALRRAKQEGTPLVVG